MSFAVLARDDRELSFDDHEVSLVLARDAHELGLVARTAGQLFVLFLCGMLVAAAIVQLGALDRADAGGGLPAKPAADPSTPRS